MFELTRLNLPAASSLVDSGDAASGVIEFLEFKLAGEAFAFALPRILEIQTSPRVTPVPRAPSDVLGIFSVRGRLLTLICLRRRLGLPPHTSIPKDSRVLLTQTSDGEVIGLLVDSVVSVVRLGSEEIEPTQSVFGSEASEHTLGIARGQNGPVVLLDMEKVAP